MLTWKRCVVGMLTLLVVLAGTALAALLTENQIKKLRDSSPLFSQRSEYGGFDVAGRIRSLHPDGTLEMVGATSGSLKILPTAATAQVVTLTTAAQTGGAGTLTIPNLAGATETIATVAGPDVFADTKLSSKLVKAVAQKAFGSLLMTGIPVDQQLLTIAGRKYEIDENDSGGLEGGGDVNVPMGNTMTAEQAVTRIATAITGDAPATWMAVADTTNDILHLYAKTAGGWGNAITLAENFTNGDVSDATLSDGADAAVKVNVCYRHIITVWEATGGAVAALRFDTGLSSICSVQVTYEDAGVNAASDVVIDVTDGIVTLVEGAAPAWDAGDIINLVVIGLE
ncbi:MAG TPA: hypothetical protein VMY35_19170 [Phycisphaerae bacterium]|nr:hypothetical protein [Phycisphaerae bacterium]